LDFLGERSVASATFESREARRLAAFHASEEGEKRLVQAFQGIDLNSTEAGADFRQFSRFGQLPRLLDEPDRFPLPVTQDTFFERAVVDEARVVQGPLGGELKGGIAKQFVLEGFDRRWHGARTMLIDGWRFGQQKL